MVTAKYISTNDDSDLIQLRIENRQTSSQKYLLRIRVSAADIETWSCKCLTGERMLACAHMLFFSPLTPLNSSGPTKI
jgi:hypothetical protein